MKKRVLSMIIACLMMVCLFVSCDEPVDDDTSPAEKTLEEVMTAADDALGAKAYTATSTTVLECEDADMAATILEMQDTLPTITYSVKGGQFVANLTTSVAGMTLEKTYILKDSVLYSDSTLSSGDDILASVKEKAVFEEEKVEEALTAIGAGATIVYTDFGSTNLTSDAAGHIVSFSNMKEDVLKNMETVLGGSLESTGAVMTLKAVSMNIEIADDKYKSTVVTYEYEVRTMEDSYTITMTVTTVYDYITEVVINSPEDVSKFEIVEYEEIFK